MLEVIRNPRARVRPGGMEGRRRDKDKENENRNDSPPFDSSILSFRSSIPIRGLEVIPLRY